MNTAQGEPTSGRQLTLDFSDGVITDEPSAISRSATRTIVFPKHISIPNFGQFQRQINSLFSPLGITVEFRLTRQKRLELKWVFPSEKQIGSNFYQKSEKHPFEIADHSLSAEELKAFETVVFSLANAN